MVRRFAWLILLLLAAWPASPEAVSGGLEGRWHLAAQGRGAGESPPAPLWLEFRSSGMGWSCLVATERTASPLPWPAFVTQGGPQRLVIEQRDIDARSGRALARYRVTSNSPDGQSLLVIEEYHLAPGGGTLEGTVTVRLFQDGEDKGGYSLRRTFARETAP